MDTCNKTNFDKLIEDLKNLKFLLVSEGIEANINFIIQILNDIINIQKFDIYLEQEVASFILTLKYILKLTNTSNIYINLCIEYIENMFLIQNLFNETIKNFEQNDDRNNKLNIDEKNNKKLIIKNAPENDPYLITEIPSVAAPNYYFKNRFINKDGEEIEDTYFYEENGTITFTGRLKLEEPKLSNLFTNLLGEEILSENELND